MYKVQLSIFRVSVIADAQNLSCKAMYYFADKIFLLEKIGFSRHTVRCVGVFLCFGIKLGIFQKRL